MRRFRLDAGQALIGSSTHPTYPGGIRQTWPEPPAPASLTTRVGYLLLAARAVSPPRAPGRASVPESCAPANPAGINYGEVQARCLNAR